MRIDIITIFPEMFDGFFNNSIVKIAKDKKLVDIHIHNVRDYTKDKHNKVDDYPYSGGGGMVMTIQPIADCIDKLKSERDYDEVFYTAPDGEILEQKNINHYSTLKNIIILCGHYKGVDERVREHYVTKEFSLGNFVLSGGEIAAATLTDAVVRLIPGVLGDENSAMTDSFQNDLVAPPVYTRPYEYKGWKVPDVLLSGNDRLVDEWKHQQSVKRTKERRPDMLKDD